MFKELSQHKIVDGYILSTSYRSIETQKFITLTSSKAYYLSRPQVFLNFVFISSSLKTKLISSLIKMKSTDKVNKTSKVYKFKMWNHFHVLQLTSHNSQGERKLF